ncbi:hypothetical protein EVAR_95341_1 [Eumeta japonica]|uniref:Uncharacterized protein n=1 Tax=Eumeta variegata TaxID=151549 RepID=A0A4C1U9A5_EUMVA|nr:hypothetical protein EVAR_95341_1 [Eumeta japonica]
MFSARWCVLALALWVAVTDALVSRKIKRDVAESLKSGEENEERLLEDDEVHPSSFDSQLEPCQCGVFMSQQVGKEGRRWRARGPPSGEPVITYDTDGPELPCGALGTKHCLGKCIDVVGTFYIFLYPYSRPPFENPALELH